MKLENQACGTALLLIDVVNSLDFEGNEGLVAAATTAAPRIDALARRARSEGVPVIYVNDNFRQWRSDFRSIVEGCARRDKPRYAVSDRLQPRDGDYLVLKPCHSAFFATPLEILLHELGVTTLVLAGFATNLCGLFPAHDAHMRHFDLVVPRDCTGSNSPSMTEHALRHFGEALGAETPRVRLARPEASQNARARRRSHTQKPTRGP